jgi:rubredoxin
MCCYDRNDHESYLSFPAAGKYCTSLDDNRICSQCGYKWTQHEGVDHKGRTNGYKQHHTCPVMAYACPKSERKSHFQPTEALLVKEFATPDSENNVSFNISDESQRARLLKLIEFLSHE